MRVKHSNQHRRLQGHIYCISEVLYYKCYFRFAPFAPLEFKSAPFNMNLMLTSAIKAKLVSDIQNINKTFGLALFEKQIVCCNYTNTHQQLSPTV